MSGREGSDVRGNQENERNDMSDDNRLEESRLDADHIDRLTRELAAMQARAEKAEADLATANECEAARLDSLTRELSAKHWRAIQAEAIIAACLRAMPVGNVTLHTPESLPDRIRFLASEVGTLARENDGLCASLSALLPKGTT